ncbi:hypothetical protein [uncultured Flavonifractor sp.]|uniref:hypothetical protein n=1 Tax=uncultured Flavonifractor sp. TaxID=1193534 RepID=UPI00259463DD|nr:hypothetical protein [uncultured Flavonifractor sp.]
MKIRKQMSEFMVLAGDKAVPLKEVLDAEALGISPAEEVEFELGEQDAFDVYDAVERERRLQEAEGRFEAHVFGTAREAISEEQEEKALEEFSALHGFSYSEAVDPESPYFLLDALVRWYYGKHDSSIDDDAQWDGAIQCVLDDLA